MTANIKKKFLIPFVNAECERTLIHHTLWHTHTTLLVMIAHSAVHTVIYTDTIHSAILFTDTSTVLHRTKLVASKVTVYKNLLEFFLNRAELFLNSVNSANSGNLINH